MIRRDSRSRRARLASGSLAALLSIVTLGCESAKQPPRATSSAKPAPATRAPTTPDREAAAPGQQSSKPVAHEPAPGANAAAASETQGPTDADAEPAPLRAPKVTVFNSGDAVDKEEDGFTVFGRDDTEVEDELPAREDLVEVGSEIAGNSPSPAIEPPNPTVGTDVLHVPAAGLRRMHELYNVWVDPLTKQVVMSAEVCRRDGALEMFACLKQSKEHESILSVYTEALVVHASLVALGVKPGKPVEFDPAYKPATGPEIEITVFWRDDEGRVRESRAQDWVRDIRTKETLAHPFVFAGSEFWRDESTGREQYLAEYGDFICVSNFSSAMIDLPVESSQSEAGLLFEPFTERIPPTGSRVTLVLTPVEPAADDAAPAAAASDIQRHDL